ncbi:hypothetical protein DPMN_132042 [Dreissena polymorpha]|uniref:Uncharacterized protein n=1 Tax=Dreissena polymorpha TaxID=45954 RepID=A0A9D4FUB4_DREPO|nr:hypothetical protein DPMN_132042 [Dreissena polymorpha]
MYVCQATLVNLEDLVSVPDHPLQVTWQHDLAVPGREDLTDRVTIIYKLLPFLLYLRQTVGIREEVANHILRQTLLQLPVKC